MPDLEERMTFAARQPWPGLAAGMQGDAFRFRFALRPARPGWLGVSDGDAAVLERRRALLEERWAMPWTPAADAAWERVETHLEPDLRIVGQGLRTPHERARAVASAWAPDFVLLRSMGDGLRMVGGAVCFPSGWDPLEKLCGTVGFIHGPVPGLNDDLGVRIDRFVGGLQAGDVLERDNWGLAATGRLDLHPDGDVPRIRGGGGGGWVVVSIGGTGVCGAGRRDGVVPDPCSHVAPGRLHFGHGLRRRAVAHGGVHVGRSGRVQGGGSLAGTPAPERPDAHLSPGAGPQPKASRAASASRPICSRSASMDGKRRSGRSIRTGSTSSSRP